jgi:hypothetical protein
VWFVHALAIHVDEDIMIVHDSQTSKQVLASSEKAAKQKQFSNNWGNNPAR